MNSSGSASLRPLQRRSANFRYSAIRLALLAGFGLGLPLSAQAVDIEYRLKGTLAGVADGGRDLDLLGIDDTSEASLDVTPWVHFQFSPDWAAFVRVRGYAATGELLQPGNDDNNAEASDDAFVALREAWVEYGGITDYPGEVLRIGRQRIRDDDAQFLDQDIDAARWIFETTLLDAEFGIGHQFDSYRTDDVDTAREQKDRTYAFGSIAWDWAPMQRFGVRGVYAKDWNDLPDDGQRFDPYDRRHRAKELWAGVFADSHAYDWKLEQKYAYWASATLLVGDRDTALSDPQDPDVASGRGDEDVRAWAAEAGARMRVAGPLQVGAAFAHSSGGTPGDSGKQFEQTGAQSNYSRFTGTRAQIYRYNEAFRPELGNLQAATLFASTAVGRYDASLVYNHFRRPEAGSTIVSNGLVVAPQSSAHELGDGLDLVLSGYFSLRGDAIEAPRYTPQEIGDSSLRLRASWFKPGAAYDRDAPDAQDAKDAKDDYRVALELTLWY